MIGGRMSRSDGVMSDRDRADILLILRGGIVQTATMARVSGPHEDRVNEKGSR